MDTIVTTLSGCDNCRCVPGWLQVLIAFIVGNRYPEVGVVIPIPVVLFYARFTQVPCSCSASGSCWLCPRCTPALPHPVRWIADGSEREPDGHRPFGLTVVIPTVITSGLLFRQQARRQVFRSQPGERG